jgi:hypothetical protein
MKENKLTPEEIKKALECCSKPYNLCDECPISNDIKDDCKCGENLAKNALDLINRQQAEIERLTINMNAFGLGMKREKERADIIRAEAIKEFARALRQQAFDRLYVSIDDIDRLVKEMVGEDK